MEQGTFRFNSSAVIDTDADPRNVPGLTLKCHQAMGKLDLSLLTCSLYLSPHQIGGKTVVGKSILKELREKTVLPANVLDYLLEHPGAIPKELKNHLRKPARYIFFWGTLYQNEEGQYCVRCLAYKDEQCIEDNYCFAFNQEEEDLDEWGSCCPALIAA